MSDKKAPITALTVTGAIIRTAEAARTFNSIIGLMGAELKEIRTHGRKRTARS